MVSKQPIMLGPRHPGNLVTVIIEDTCYRILHGGKNWPPSPAATSHPITRLYVCGKGTQAS